MPKSQPKPVKVEDSKPSQLVFKKVLRVSEIRFKPKQIPTQLFLNRKMKRLFGLIQSSMQDYMIKLIVKAKKSSDENEKDQLVAFLKANAFKSRQFGRMKVDTLRKHYQVKEKEVDKVQDNEMSAEKEMEQLKAYLVQHNLSTANFEKLRRQVAGLKEYESKLEQGSYRTCNGNFS
ncbi:hypothetical protein L1987_43411 [Smallanthus sonchifolius]|uniref:Uncharacterized protein n=1 Tax=Smallanthus sonchifolius TaxID=185202 RepID=A0ACB9GLC0_9ASTR|nr:hypothetical protein L1987_43411 [Smallanthus sonchifolius]